jgi:hypothetical protein
MMSWLTAACTARQKAQTLTIKAPKFEPCFWASETEPGIWHVQFSSEFGIRPKIDGIEAETCWEAVEKARKILLLDDYARDGG